MHSLRAGDSAKERPPCYDERLWWTRMRSESDATALRCSWLRHPHVGSRRAGCSAPTVNPTQGGLRDATEYLTGDAPAVRRPGSAPAGVPRPGSAALRPVRLAAPRGGLAAGGETTAESGVHISMRPGAGSNSRCGFKFEISRAVRVLKLDSEVALPGSGAWEQPPSRPWGARSAFPSRSLRSNVARGYGSPGPAGRDPCR